MVGAQSYGIDMFVYYHLTGVPPDCNFSVNTILGKGSSDFMSKTKYSDISNFWEGDKSELEHNNNLDRHLRSSLQKVKRNNSSITVPFYFNIG